jgi:HSP20 family protein
MADKRQAENRGQRDEQRGLQASGARGRDLATRRDPFDIFNLGPFGIMRRMHEDVDRLFGGQGGDWVPAIEAFQRGNEFVVRADVPGLSRDDLTVEMGDDALTICGERKLDHEEERDGVYRSERSYGSFCRVVPLPEGAVAESAKANFKDGVLEVVVQAPSQEVRRGRRIEIGQESSRQPK